jgi:hypothetical protein
LKLKPEKTYEQMRDEIKAIAMKMHEKGDDEMTKYKVIVENRLGKGLGVKDTTPQQAQLMELILSDLNDEGYSA